MKVSIYKWHQSRNVKLCSCRRNWLKHRPTRFGKNFITCLNSLTIVNCIHLNSHFANWHIIRFWNLQSSLLSGSRIKSQTCSYCHWTEKNLIRTGCSHCFCQTKFPQSLLRKRIRTFVQLRTSEEDWNRNARKATQRMQPWQWRHTTAMI